MVPMRRFPVSGSCCGDSDRGPKPSGSVVRGAQQAIFQSAGCGVRTGLDGPVPDDRRGGISHLRGGAARNDDENMGAADDPEFCMVSHFLFASSHGRGARRHYCAVCCDPCLCLAPMGERSAGSGAFHSLRRLGGFCDLAEHLAAPPQLGSARRTDFARRTDERGAPNQGSVAPSHSSKASLVAAILSESDVNAIWTLRLASSSSTRCARSTSRSPKRSMTASKGSRSSAGWMAARPSTSLTICSSLATEDTSGSWRLRMGNSLIFAPPGGVLACFRLQLMRQGNPCVPPEGFGATRS